MIWIAALLCAASSGWIVVGLVALWSATRRRPRRNAGVALLPATVLKPLCGADADLEASLETFFMQDHPDYQIVFGVERADDPALAVVERLVARHPSRSCRIVVTAAAARGHNPKVRNLRAMLGAADHDLVVVSDSNVRVPAHYLRELVEVYVSEPDVGLVTNIVAGVGERSLAGALECIQLCGFCAIGSAVPTLMGDAAVVGKSMLLSRARLEALGGLARVADVLAEDYVLGKTVQHAGFGVRIAPTVVENVVGPLTLRAHVERHLRWALIRFRLRPQAFLLEPLASPLALLPVAFAAFGPAAFPWAFAAMLVRDVGGWLILRGPRGVAAAALLGLVREVVGLGVWLAAPLTRHVVWRGHRVRVGAGTLLYST